MNDHETMISVIVPVYNTEQYLKRCISSILNQSYSNYEIICVNDGSDDGSYNYMCELQRQDSRIKVINKSHEGSGSARRVAALVAQGNYIACIDSDDWIEPDMFRDMIEIIEQYDVDVVMSGFIRDYGTYQIVEPEHMKSGLYFGDAVKDLKDNLIDYEHFVRFNVSASLSNKIIKTSLVRPYLLNIPPEVLIDTDTVCSYPAIWDAVSGYVTEKCYYHYCQNVQSVMHDIKPDRTPSIVAAYEYMNRIVETHPSDIGNRLRQSEFLEVYSWCNYHPARLFGYSKNRLSGYGSINPSDKLVLYGAGSFGRHLYQFITEQTELNVVAFVDRASNDPRVIKPEALTDMVFDKVLVCVLLYEIVENIKAGLSELGIDENRIITINPEELYESLNNS